MPKLLLASTNKGKLDEIQALLGNLAVELMTSVALGLHLSVEETGQTYAANATIKAQSYAQASGLITLADDSGLEVEALGGLPGIRSARFAPKPGATDRDRRQYLLTQLGEYPRPWRARFVCTVALATPEGELVLASGECPGEIIPEERGKGGFGYDPIFLLLEMGRTMAELTMAEKNLRSHRARAVRAALPGLTELINMEA